MRLTPRRSKFLSLPFARGLYMTSQILQKLKNPGSRGPANPMYLNAGHSSMQDAIEHKLCDVPLGGTLGVVG